MYKYIFNTRGEYVAYIYDNKYCFSNSNDYIGFFIGIKLYDYSGKYMGSLTSDDRIVKNIMATENDILGRLKPLKPFLPYAPYNRYAMTKLPDGYEDVFEVGKYSLDLYYLDTKYNKFINCSIYSNDNEFLGVISFNKYDKKSMANKYGDYGSEYSKISLFNKYGMYGSEYSAQSPFNKYSDLPSKIINKENKIVAEITANKYYSGNCELIDAIEFFNWFNYRTGKRKNM